MKKVVSIALFGTGDTYAQYLSAHVLAHHNLYPRAEGWDLWLHIDEEVVGRTPPYHFDAQGHPRSLRFINRAIERGLLKCARHGEVEGKTKAMLWRMSPLFDGDYADAEYVFCRDLDAPPMPRDRACMEQFIISKMDVHTVHDNEQHVGIMGGLCGFQTKTFREKTGLNSLADLYAFAGEVDWALHGADQYVLNRLVTEKTNLTLLEHRYNGWYNGPGAHEPHRAGTYKCKACSTRVPDSYVGNFLRWMPEQQRHRWFLIGAISDAADQIGAHLGCAGYDHKVARAFWEEHGDPEIARLVKECEAT